MPFTTAKDLIGQRFGNLVVIARAENVKKRAHWLCRCDCGATAVKMGKYLACGDTQSCGCAQREYRAGGNRKFGTIIAKKDFKREYTIWRSMKSRCLTPSSSNYRFYGGRGITVCDRWRNDFLAFLGDMGRCPPGLTIERNDPDGNYEPTNCRWATWAEQHALKRQQRVPVEMADIAPLKAAGMSQLAIARKLGVSQGTVSRRMRGLGRQVMPPSSACASLQP